jgi:uncharacterized protein YjbI with pentapeptide repeats
MNKSQLRKRWTDPRENMLHTINQLTQHPIVLENADLAGIEISGRTPNLELRLINFYKAQLRHVDLKSALIACSMSESIMQDVDFSDATLSKCGMKKANITNCKFIKSKLTIVAHDAIFDNCNFTDAQFLCGKQGHEYGGRRVKFHNCNFTRSIFKHVEFRATLFSECLFESARFIGCDFRGTKSHNSDAVVQQFENMDVPAWVGNIT